MTTTADARAETEALLSELVGLTDKQVRAPSLLPGWSRGHVLNHLARSADAMARAVKSARTGVPIAPYASPEARAADLERGSGRPIGELLADLTSTGDRLLADLESLPSEALDALVRLGSRDYPASRIAFLRLREVAVHRVDLGLGFRTADWANSFIVEMLDDLTPVLQANGTPVADLVSTDLGRTWTVGGPGPTLTGPANDLVAWVVGRPYSDALAVTAGAIPPGPTWI